MKKYLASLTLGLALLGGCHKTNLNPPPPLAPGYISTVDQSLKQTLDAATAFYNRIQSDSASGKVSLSQSEKDAFNSLALAINTAQPIYAAYHNGTGSQAAAQTAVSNVQQQQSSVQSLGVK